MLMDTTTAAPHSMVLFPVMRRAGRTEELDAVEATTSTSGAPIFARRRISPGASETEAWPITSRIGRGAATSNDGRPSCSLRFRFFVTLCGGSMGCNCEGSLGMGIGSFAISGSIFTGCPDRPRPRPRPRPRVVARGREDEGVPDDCGGSSALTTEPEATDRGGPKVAAASVRPLPSVPVPKMCRVQVLFAPCDA